MRGWFIFLEFCLGRDRFVLVVGEAVVVLLGSRFLFKFRRLVVFGLVV